MPEHTRPRLRYPLGVSVVWLSLWLVPVAIVLTSLGTQHVFSQIAVFFSKMAMVPLAVPTPCLLMWPSRPSNTMVGSRQEKC